MRVTVIEKACVEIQVPTPVFIRLRQIHGTVEIKPKAIIKRFPNTPGHKVQFQAMCLPPYWMHWGGQNQRAHPSIHQGLKCPCQKTQTGRRLGYAPNIRFCCHRDNMRRMLCFQRELFRRLRRVVNPGRRGFGCADHAANARLAGVLR